LIKIKNWHKFQHFKDRKPPWIKLYRDIMDDINWHELSGDDAKTLIMLWVIASENNGELLSDKELAFRLRVTEKSIKSTLSRLSEWVETERYQDDINLSQNNSVADVSDHQERETELEKETETDSLSSPSVKTPSQQLLDIYHKKCTYLPKVQIFSDERKRLLKARFMQVMKTESWTTEQTVEWFDGFYESINRSKFLCGLTSPGPSGRAFKADWDWIHTPSHFVKICEGKYDGV
jgi:hypothetical protein